MKNIFLCSLVTLCSSVILAQSDTMFAKYDQAIPGSDIKFTMVPIPAGSFLFGSAAKDKIKDPDETPAHTVAISKFWMGIYEVTYEEFTLFFNDVSLSQNIPTDAITRPSSPYIDLTLGMGKAGNFPANSMQPYGALMYCKWLYSKTGIFFRLPTEAEWEYACRAGATTVYPFGDDERKLKDYAWYSANSENKYHKVGLKKPNAWGLYDMLGNVEEWVLDQYDEKFYSSIAENAIDPMRTPEKRYPRIVRGGSFKDEGKELRAANRTVSDPIWNRRDPQIPKSKWWNADAPFVGFRIIRPMKQPTPEEAETFFKTYLGF
jgi:formylglycine-generating enzyme required for sulfatase activity